MKIRNRRKCLDYQMNTKEILEYPLLPPWVEIKRPYNLTLKADMNRQLVLDT
jgi:hypothetical protein